MPKLLLPERAKPVVRAEQVRLLHHQGISSQLIGTGTAFIAVAMLWAVVDHTHLLAWLLLMLAVSVARLAFTLRFTHIVIDRGALDKWCRTYVVGTLASGLVWGGLAFFYDPSWPVPYQVMLFVIYTGITAGSFNANTYVFIAFPAFFLPPVLCLMAVMLAQRGRGFYELSALFAAYILSMYVTALKFHNSMTRSLEIRFENEMLAAKLAHSNQELSELADMDGLTKIHNRRAMDRYLASEWNRHYRNQEPLSMLFIDIDYFKQYNDTYGHDGGDQCLVQVAQILDNHAHRSTDMAARFGGEEFAVILPETRASAALQIAEKIAADLKARQIPHSSSPGGEFLTMSIGVSTAIPHVTDNAELLWASADKALYRAKKDGRDRVVMSVVS